MQDMQKDKKKIFCDTNILMSYSTEIFNKYKDSTILISGYVLNELDKHKMSSDENRKFQARRASRDIENNEDKIEYVIKEGSYLLPGSFDESSMDNKIISVLKNLYTIDGKIIGLSNDLLFRQKCKLLGLPCEKFDDEKEDNEIYTGYKEAMLTDEELAEHYQNPTNKWGLLNNEYLIIKNSNGEVIDKQKWVDSKGFIPLSYKQIDNIYTGKIKPRNIQQELAFDLFQNRNITVKVIFGKFGSGKDMIMSAHALNMIQRGFYDKLIFVRNNYGVKNSKEVGFLKGDLNEKLFPFAAPLSDHVGGMDGLKMLINQGKVELQHFGFIRGRDIKNSIIYVSEAENMTKEHIQLLISRIAEGSTLWLNGDFKQVDDGIFERNSGLKQIINCLKGNELFGCVEFSITERSKTAQLADLLD
jgi:PhoH-like ATPase